MFINKLNREEEMTPITYRPDWLLSPPPKNPYLIKEEYVMAPKALDRFLYKLYLLSNPENIELKQYLNREEGSNLQLAQKNIKSIQQQIENNKLLENNSGTYKPLDMKVKGNKEINDNELPERKVLH